MQVPPPSSNSTRKPAVERAPQRPPAAGSGQAQAPGAAGPVPSRPPQATALDVAAQFIVDPQTHRVLVRIYDTRTGETIRTIPPNEVVEFLLRSGGLDIRA
jgi:hypothetical protein